MPTVLATPPQDTLAVPSFSNGDSWSNWDDEANWTTCNVEISALRTPQSGIQPHYPATQAHAALTPANPATPPKSKESQAQMLFNLFGKEAPQVAKPVAAPSEILQQATRRPESFRKSYSSNCLAPNKPAESLKQENLMKAVFSSLEKEKARLAEYRAPTIRVVESAPDVHCDENGFYLEPPETVIRRRIPMPKSPPETPSLQVMSSTPQSDPYNSFVFQEMNMSAVLDMEAPPPKDWLDSGSGFIPFNPKHTSLYYKMLNAVRGYEQPELDVEALIEELEDEERDDEPFEYFPVWYKRPSKYGPEALDSPCERLSKKAAPIKMKIRRRSHGVPKEPTECPLLEAPFEAVTSDRESHPGGTSTTTFPSSDPKAEKEMTHDLATKNELHHRQCIVSHISGHNLASVAELRPLPACTSDSSTRTPTTFRRQALHSTPYILMMLYFFSLLGPILWNIIIPGIVILLLIPESRNPVAPSVIETFRSFQARGGLLAFGRAEYGAYVWAIECVIETFKIQFILGIIRDEHLGVLQHVCLAVYGAVIGRMMLSSVVFWGIVACSAALVFVATDLRAEGPAGAEVGQLRCRHEPEQFSEGSEAT